MADFEWDITESIPTEIGTRAPGAAVFSISTDAFDVSLGGIPFLLYASAEHPYERNTGEWRKEQFDASPTPGEQSLGGWWLRSQTDFSGGSGVTYFEPLLGEGSENRFRDSRGVNVFDTEGRVTLLNEQTLAQAGGSDLELVGLGESLALYRNGSSFYTVGPTGIATARTPLGTTPTGIARIPGSAWLIGHTTGVSRMSSTGVTSAVITGATAACVPYWCKGRIFATQGRRIYQKALTGGALDETVGGTDLIFEHRSTSWTWVDVVETGGAVWAAGKDGVSSSIHAFSVDAQGELPEITAGTVAVEMPAGETITCLASYLDFLLIGTTAGFRVAITSGAQAELGPLLWRDEAASSIAARGDFVWVGVTGGLTRRVNLGVTTFNDLAFAWANDAESGGSGAVQGVAFANDKLLLATADTGCTYETTDLVESGFLSAGFARFGTLESKFFSSLVLVADVSSGSVTLSAETESMSADTVITLADFNGSRDINLSLPNGGLAERVGVTFTLTREAGDATKGPSLDAYQLRAMPAPDRKNRLVRMPLLCKDREKNRWGVERGAKGYAWARVNGVEVLDDRGTPVVFRDHRTGEARLAAIEEVNFRNEASPDRDNTNYGGLLSVTVRFVD